MIEIVSKRASLRASARQLYEYDLPWIIHAAAQQLRVAGESEQADTLDEIALLVELGLPTDAATRIFLAGVRSRVAATEIAALGVEFGTGTAQTRRLLATTAFAQRVQVRLSAPSSDWLDLLREEDSQHRPGTVPPFASWTERDDPGVGVLHARKLDGNLFLCSTDGSVRFNVSPTEARPFDRLANDHRMAFTQDGSTWRLTPRDPRLS